LKVLNETPKMWCEAELIARIKAGDSDGFERLIEPYSKGLLSTIRRKVRNDADADDICQEVLVKAFSKLHQFRGNALFSTWLYRIAINEVSEHFRRQRAANTVALSGHETELPSKSPHALAIFEMETMRMAVVRTLARMPDADRKALVLFHMRELSVSETARELRMPCSTVKSRLLRARVRLRREWRSTAFGDRATAALHRGMTRELVAHRSA
jgi:RNA polymerase sigma-70 factor (ECF subfamily)